MLDIVTTECRNFQLFNYERLEGSLTGFESKPSAARLHRIGPHGTTEYFFPEKSGKK